LLKEAGLDVLDCTGLAWNPASGFHLSDNKSLNYLVTARKAA
jgi:2-polyprenyl-6-hydroxyphenyl methylase/3-demethylubiquinone-9 3-methyltransferase